MERYDVMHVVLNQCAKPFFSGGRESTVGEERDGEGLVGFGGVRLRKLSAECIR